MVKIENRFIDIDEKAFDLGVKYTPTDHTWVGAKIGIFAISNKLEKDGCGYADYLSVVTTEI